MSGNTQADGSAKRRALDDRGRGLAYGLPFMVVVTLVVVRFVVLPAVESLNLASAQRVVPPLMTWSVAAIAVSTALVATCILAWQAVAHFAPSSASSRVWRAALVTFGRPLVVIVGAVELVGEPSFMGMYDLLNVAPDLPDGVFWGSRILGALGFTTTGLAGLAAVTLGLRIEPVHEDDVRPRAVTLRTLLYLAAVGLAAGTLATGARLELQVGALTGEAREQALIVARAATLGYGGMFTLFLVAAFAPATRSIRAAAMTTYAKAESELDRDAWLDAHGLGGNMGSRFAQVLAAFAPLLAPSMLSGAGSAITGLVH